ncbi:hypothetical protein H4R20_002182 [Coemansia guatemalensis]|uniref:Uncharacterized protein n=1 Tax=Coemansia guatemalensis TaxID=2761395 RepID=A0A9W8HXQ7_9FUNG|nr:hypothetical protein H4R20_002182 [Coemansia guatemalensis]
MGNMQASLDRVKELEQTNTRHEREERTFRASNERVKGEVHALRTENNNMRTEVLGYTRELDKLRREARSEAYKSEKKLDDMRLENMRLRAESKENRRMLDECQMRLEARAMEKDPGGRIPRIVVNRPLNLTPAREQREESAITTPPPAIVDLVDLSSRRINALEEEIEQLEEKLRTTSAEVSAAQLEVKERDLEILRLNSEQERRGDGSTNEKGQALYGADPVARLNDQVDYLHERSETLEKECQEQRAQFQKEKEELHRRWVQTENERVRLAERIRELGASPDNGSSSTKEQQQEVSSSPKSPATDAEVSRLRTECANIKSLYAQTRDQLQELLRTGNADAKQAQEQAQGTEETLRRELEDARREAEATQTRLTDEVSKLQKQADDSAMHMEVAQSRERQIGKLEKRLAKLGDRLEAEQREHAKEASRLSAQLDKAREEASAAQQTAGSQQRQHDAAVAEYRQLVEQHSKLDRSLKQAVSEIAEWRAKADERSHKVSELTRRLDESRLAHKQDSAELRACRRTLDNLSGDLATLRDAHANAQRDAKRAREELEHATKLRRATELSKDDYKRQLVKAMAEAESHRSLVDHLQAERRALRVQVRAQFHLSQRLEQRLEALDPAYAHEPLAASVDVSYAHLPRPRIVSRTSSAAHSSRSFDDIPNAASAIGSVELPAASHRASVLAPQASSEGNSTSTISLP